MKRRSIVLVLCLMLLMVLAGCGKEVVEENSTSPTSEVVSEVVSEEVSEEVSEVVSEEPSEEVSEEESNEVEYVNFSNVNELLGHLEKYDRTTIVQYNFSEEGAPQAIIPNGGYYTINEGSSIRIIPNKEVNDVKANVPYISIEVAITGWAIDVQTTGEDLEVSFTVNYADGTSEDFTIYVTVE